MAVNCFNKISILSQSSGNWQSSSPGKGFFQFSERNSFLSAQGNIWASAGFDYDQEEVGGVRKETGGRSSEVTATSGNRAGTWAVPHLRVAVFLDPAGVRPVGDPNCLGSGEQREVEWAGSRPGHETPRNHT